MAQLTLAQRSKLANDPEFQHRVMAAVKKTANYWQTNAGADLNVTSNFTQKKFAEKILSGSFAFPISTYVEYFLTQYNTDPPVWEDESQTYLADSELTDSFASASTFEYFSKL